jgi:hypothetical protein
MKPNLPSISIMVILVAFSIDATSQEFAPVGAKWHYDQGTFNPGLTTSYTPIQSMVKSSLSIITNSPEKLR